MQTVDVRLGDHMAITDAASAVRNQNRESLDPTVMPLFHPAAA